MLNSLRIIIRFVWVAFFPDYAEELTQSVRYSMINHHRMIDSFIKLDRFWFNEFTVEEAYLLKP